MREKLWFVNNGVSVVAIFNNRNEAEQEYNRYREDPDFTYYRWYSLALDDLEDYPEEYDYALDQGFIG